MAQFLAEGNTQVLDEQYADAVDTYTRGLEVEPQNEELLLRRSNALFQMGKYMQALSDANNGLEVAPENTGLMMRKGRACFALDEFESAVEMFRKGKAAEPDSKKWDTWIRKCEAELEYEEEDEDQPIAAEVANAKKEKVVEETAPPPEKVQKVKPKVRREWYQTDQAVVVTFFARGVQEGQLHLDFSDSKTLKVVIDDDVYDSTLNLQAAVKTDAVKSRIFGSKVEVTLPKAQQVRWASLEGAATGPVSSMASQLPDDLRPAHTYPSSSRKQQPNWDKLIAEEEEEPEGEEALNKVFKDIFARGTDEQKKAMMKSFTESAGTVLSTNWDEVGTKKVEISPPDGLEVKSYNEWEKK